MSNIELKCPLCDRIAHSGVIYCTYHASHNYKTELKQRGPYLFLNLFWTAMVVGICASFILMVAVLAIVGIR